MNTITNDIAYDPAINGVGRFSGKQNECVAEEFESLFIYQLMNEMEKTGDREESDMLYGENEKTFRSMFNQELSRDLARSGGLGLRPLIMNELNLRADEDNTIQK